MVHRIPNAAFIRIMRKAVTVHISSSPAKVYTSWSVFQYGKCLSNIVLSV